MFRTLALTRRLLSCAHRASTIVIARLRACSLCGRVGSRSSRPMAALHAFCEAARRTRRGAHGKCKGGTGIGGGARVSRCTIGAMAVSGALPAALGSRGDSQGRSSSATRSPAALTPAGHPQQLHAIRAGGGGPGGEGRECSPGERRSGWELEGGGALAGTRQPRPIAHPPRHPPCRPPSSAPWPSPTW